MKKMIAALLMVLLSLTCTVLAHADDDFLSKPSIPAPDSRSLTSGIQEAIDALPPEGGTVFVPAGVYLLKASVELRSDVHLMGEGFSSILRHVDETKSALDQDAAAGQNQVVVTSAAGFEIGMSVIIKNDNINAGWEPNLRTITDINGNTITLDSDLDRLISKDPNGVVVNAFPVIKADAYHNGTTYYNILIENIKIEGNRDNVGKYTFQQAGIALVRTVGSTIRNVWVDGSNYEGISDQGVGDTWNTISDNLITDSASIGLHLGTICRHFTVSGNRILNSNSDGIFFCNVIQSGHLTNNFISGNGGSGMGAIDHSGSSGDNFNVIEGNTITLNGRHGIEAEGSAYNTIINNVIEQNSQSVPGAYSGIHMDGVTGFLVCGNKILQNDGPGIYSSESDPTLVNNLIASNTAGGIDIVDSTVVLTNNTVAENSRPSPGGGISIENSTLTITNSVLWGNTPDQLYLVSGDVPTVSYSDVQDGFAGTGNIDEDPLFTSGPMGDFYLGQTAAGQVTDSACLNAGGDLAQNTCFTIDQVTTCLDQLTTSSCHALETGMVDMGFHDDARNYSTLTAELACAPTAGTLPFTTTIGATLTSNYSNMNRLGKAVISISLAGGGIVSNWKAGIVGFDPEEIFHISFPQVIPAMGTVLGTNTLELTIDDVTPPPYNQPPFPPSGDHDTDSCTVEGFAP